MTIANNSNAARAGRAYPAWLQAYRDAARAIAAMPAVFPIAFAAVTAMEAIPLKILFPEMPGVSPWPPFLARMSFLISAKALILAPLLIAVHRYVILGETVRGFPIRPAGRYLRFVACAAVFEIAIQLPIEAISVKMLEQAVSGTASVPPIVLIPLAFIVAAIAPLLLLPTLLVFPAIAVDAPEVKAWREGIRHYWRLFYTMVLAWLPLPVIEVSYLVLVRTGTLPPPLEDTLSPLTAGSAAITVLSCAMTVFFGAVFAAAVSRLYRSFTGVDAHV